MATKLHIREVPNEDNFHSVRLFLQDVRNHLMQQTPANVGGDQLPSKSSVSQFGLKREWVKMNTGIVVPAGQQTGTVNLGKTFSLMALTASLPCRIRLYSNAVSRTADLAAPRALTQEPLAFSEHGVIFDWNTTDEATPTGGIWLQQDNWKGGYVASTSDAVESYSAPGLGGHVITPGTFVAVAMQVLPMDAALGSAFIRDASNNVLKTVFSGIKTPLAPTPAWYTSFPYGPSPDYISIKYFALPPGADNCLFHLEPLDPTFYLRQWVGVTFFNSSPGLTYPHYPVSFVCSPEAFGSDLSPSPTGQICYVVDNLSDITSDIAINFEILREEK